MYKIKEIKKPAYVENFRLLYGFIPYVGQVITKKQKNIIYEFERKNSDTVFVILEKVGEK